MSSTKNQSGVGYRGWRRILFASGALGFVLGLLLREWTPEIVTFIIGLLGYLAGILSIGTSNIFQPDSNKHYSAGTQRAVTCFAAAALAATLPSLLS